MSIMELLCNYDWPRNLRQLEHEVHRLVLKGRDNEVVGTERLTPEIRTNANARTIPPAEIVEDCIRISLSLPYPERRGELQRLSIITALTETNGNLNQAAAIMRMSRNGLKKMIKRFGIEVEKYRQWSLRDHQ